MKSVERATVVDVDHAAMDEMMVAFAVLAAELEQLRFAAAGRTRPSTAPLRVKAVECLRAAKARVADAHDVALAKSRAGGRATDAFVHANPWAVVAVGALVGLALGMIAARECPRGRGI